jgi:8-oxo-dGTP diphosphatase
MNPTIPGILEKLISIIKENPLAESKKVIEEVMKQVDHTLDYENIKLQYDKAVKLVFEKPNLSAKAFIVDNQNKVLIVKRSKKDIQKPGIWEIPGGMLKEGENPHLSLIRRIKEEVGLDIEVKNVLEIHHFTRDNGQKIIMNVYLCKPSGVNVKLSQEHTEFEWVHISNVKDKLDPFFHKEVDTFIRQN